MYEVLDERARRRAVKVVSKSQIKTKKNKTKLWAEIKLHQMLQHPNIVRFDDCFEDDENVYMILELCAHGSLMDLLRRRKRYTEPEARFYLTQLIGACQYMHDNNVIHRDLKLGNLFLDADMNIKVGDFGLAALIENPGERKKTICGTPNYIAPEVLFDTTNGHSFEVDVWSVGVILYTLLIGKPPFQTKDVKAIYRRIRENRYEFPPDKEISGPAMDLIMKILNSNPEQRPTLTEILQHPWFQDGPFPSYIPVSANDNAPDHTNLSPTQSRRNFDAVRRRAIGDGASPHSTTPPGKPSSQLATSIAAQERDFNNAVKPDSPISALLNSARQPLVTAPTAIKEPSLLRKLTAAGAQATLSPVRRGVQKRASMEGLAEEDEEEDEGVEVDHHGKPYEGRDRELAVQKARIVSQMAGMKLSDKGSDEERGAPARSSGKERERPRYWDREQRTSPRRALGEAHVPQHRSAASSGSGSSAAGSLKAGKQKNVYDQFEANLATAFEAAKNGGFRTPHIELSPPAPRVFVVSWLDYCTKYGMGFAMSDGTVSVHFNDTSSLVLSPNKTHVDYIAYSPEDKALQTRRNYGIDGTPSDLKTKVYLLNQFENYILNKLLGDYPYNWVDSERTKGMVFVEKYLRMKHVILFRLSNGLLQFNFYDHTKLILSSDGLVVSVIDKHYVLRTWSLEALLGPLPSDPKDRKRVESTLQKLNYARDILSKIRAHGGMSSIATAISRKEKDGKDQQKEQREKPAATAERERERERLRPIRS